VKEVSRIRESGVCCHHDQPVLCNSVHVDPLSPVQYIYKKEIKVRVFASTPKNNVLVQIIIVKYL
jgi:hypothetical protein